MHYLLSARRASSRTYFFLGVLVGDMAWNGRSPSSSSSSSSRPGYGLGGRSTVYSGHIAPFLSAPSGFLLGPKASSSALRVSPGRWSLPIVCGLQTTRTRSNLKNHFSLSESDRLRLLLKMFLGTIFD